MVVDTGLWAVCSDDLKNIRLIHVSVQNVTVRVKGYCFDILRIFLVRRIRRSVIIKVFPKKFERVPRRKNHVSLIQRDMQGLKCPDDLSRFFVVKVLILGANQPCGLEFDRDPGIDGTLAVYSST